MYYCIVCISSYYMMYFVSFDTWTVVARMSCMLKASKKLLVIPLVRKISEKIGK